MCVCVSDWRLSVEFLSFLFLTKNAGILSENHIFPYNCTHFLYCDLYYFIFLNSFLNETPIAGQSHQPVNAWFEPLLSAHFLKEHNSIFFTQRSPMTCLKKKTCALYSEAVLNFSSVVTSIRNVKNALQCILPQNKQ